MSTVAESRIEDCEGYKYLLAAVERDESGRDKGWHGYRAKLQWASDRAQHYAEKTGLNAADILDAWEKRRNYWYMNYYQDADFPLLTGERVRVFDTKADFLTAVGAKGFVCPSCGNVSASPYECTVPPCDWKVYGLLRDLGKGVHVFVNEDMRSELLFMPVAWQEAESSP